MIRPHLLCAALTVAAFSPVVRAETANPENVLAVMERVADWQIAHPDKSPPTGWVNAAYYAGAMALADVSPSPRFADAMRRMGEANAWQLGPRRYDADDHSVGQTYAELYLRDRDPRMIAPMRAEFDVILAHPKDDNLDFDPKKNPDRRDRWSWCDSLFMGPPAWIRLWSATGNRAYLDFMVEKWWVTSDYLYDRDEHLYFRDSSFFSQREKNGRKIFWSRGNGWVMAGLARVLDYLPSDHPSRPRFERQFREMAAAVIAHQQADGLWRASLLDPASYPMKETSGSGFFCYALSWGVNHGLLDRATVAPAALKAWRALVACVTDDGRLTHVQPIGATPVLFDENATAPYGVGAFLLAGSEIYRLVAPPPAPAASPRPM